MSVVGCISVSHVAGHDKIAVCKACCMLKNRHPLSGARYYIQNVIQKDDVSGDWHGVRAINWIPGLDHKTEFR